MGDSESIGSENGCRRFRISDAMILVAAVAVGLGLARVAAAGIYRPRTIAVGFQSLYLIEVVHTVAFWCVASLTVACFVLRLKRPRPPLLLMLMQPGAYACLLAIAGLMVGAVAAVTSPVSVSLSNVASSGSILIGMGIAAFWVLLWLNRMLEFEAGWIDRLGRALGVCWVVLPLLLLSAFWF